MKKCLAIFISLITLSFYNPVVGAQVSSNRVARGQTNSSISNDTETASVSARSATAVRSAVVPSAASRTSASGRTTVTRSSGTSVNSSPTVTARAATTSSVIGTGTKVATATQNVVISPECQQKYEGCMDAFCMLDNVNGGRCFCSSSYEDLEAQLAEIEEMNLQSYQLSTLGVEVIESSNASLLGTDEYNGVDLSLWNQPAVQIEPEEDDEPIGLALYAESDAICQERIPECANQIDMLQLIYSQKIKSDCVAYENSLKQQKNESTTKLAEAQKALRDAALNQFQTSNKYDLGQCISEFKNCMMTTAGCGEDFSGCATTAAFHNTNPVNEEDVTVIPMHSIIGSSSSIDIYASTYDVLLAKKPMCDSVTNNCVAVKDQVWDAFLRESAPQLKNAELIAEDNIRQTCVSDISDCFQKACKDNIDPNDPDGSYDMCLTRPESMLSFCKSELNSCGIDTSSDKTAKESEIWDYVVAKLASMRVDSCTAELKACLQSEDRCGSDYSQCVGLDTESIIQLCPYDKLTGCKIVYGEKNIKGNDVYDEVYRLVQGIMLNIDNSMIAQCQQAVDEAMLKVCGSTDNCDNLILDEGLGARSLDYNICEYSLTDGTFDIDYSTCVSDVENVPDEKLGRIPGGAIDALGPVTPLVGVLDGTIYWESVDIDSDGQLMTAEEYFAKVGDEGVKDFQKERISDEINLLQRNINSAISMIESDPTVQYCMTGRKVQGVKLELGTDEGRFPQLTRSARLQIANSALSKARKNYADKYEEYNEKMSQDYARMAERLSEIRDENSKDARRETARIACVSLADLGALPKSPTPKSQIGKYITIAVVVATAVVVTVLTAGAGTIAMGAGIAAGVEAGGSTVAAAAGAAAGIGAVEAGVAGGAGIAGAAAGMGVGGVSGALTGSIAGTAAATSLATSSTTAIAVGSVGGALGAAGTAAELSVTGNASNDASSQSYLSGYHKTDQWNFRETITTEFDLDSLVCKKCVVTQQCKKTKTPLFGDLYCDEWEEPSPETCTDIQF